MIIMKIKQTFLKNIYNIIPTMLTFFVFLQSIFEPYSEIGFCN